MNEAEKQLTAINEGLSFDEQHRHRHEDANIMKLFTNVQSNDRYHNAPNSNSIDFLKRVLK